MPRQRIGKASFSIRLTDSSVRFGVERLKKRSGSSGCKIEFRFYWNGGLIYALQQKTPTDPCLSIFEDGECDPRYCALLGCGLNM